ncbi:aldose epimerase family protein [Mariniplasma anaerobium]|uniref:Aldose 1-epimerase n=1 Tax=Mariniplasma anaerobium TaxID=2735436 RepID=A0A7R7V828_9MOLU|nr:aldose epimerase family protein [Mariniplasma anaerobium]BCR35931.1 aldose 1-epimerase [Mariniplasma anaerobium]
MKNELLIEKQNSSKGLLEIITMTNDNAEVVLISNGAGIFSYEYLGKDLVITPASIESYIKDSAYYGKTIGRTSGRLVMPSFKIDDKEYPIKAYNSKYTQLHGGATGFSKRNFFVTHVDKNDEFVKVVLRYVSKDLEEGFPGELTLDVAYQLNLDGYLDITHDATSTKDTLCNITNHAYFNFDQSQATIYNHEIKVNASHYLDIDDDNIIKAKKDVSNTAFDLRKTTNFKSAIDKMQNTSFSGFDHTWIFDSNENDIKAKVYDPATKIGLNLYTSYPAVVIYTHNVVSGIDLKGPFDAKAKHCSFTLECQFEPGGIHHKGLNQAILRKNEHYHHTIKFEPYKK